MLLDINLKEHKFIGDMSKSSHKVFLMSLSLFHAFFILGKRKSREDSQNLQKILSEIGKVPSF